MSTPFPSSWRGLRVLVVGLGLHGGAEATVRWLVQQRAIVRVTDAKTSAALRPTIQRLKGLPITMSLGRHKQDDVQWADIVVQNPGVPDSAVPIQQAHARGTLVVNEAAIFFMLCPAPLIGITGTRGKTTTTLLLAAIMKRWDRQTIVSGNVRRVAMLDQLMTIKATSRPVLELSSFQLEGLAAIERSPHIAVMTNLHVDHLNRYGQMSAYADAKYNIFRFQSAHDLAILNADNAWTARAAKVTPAQVIWFSRQGHRGAWSFSITKEWVTEKKKGRVTKIVARSAYRLGGQHQEENLLAAVAAARATGVPVMTIRAAVTSFSGVPHRQEIVRTWRGRQYINDTAATSPDGALAAMQVFPKGLFIVGGTDKDLDFTALAATIARQHIPIVLLPGTGTDKLLRALKKIKYQQSCTVAKNMVTAVRLATAQAQPKQPIILSPGAASFGLFVHEFDRGEQFIKAVRALR